VTGFFWEPLKRLPGAGADRYRRSAAPLYPDECAQGQGSDLSQLKKGDRVEITVNDQNLLVDVHTVGESSHHLVVQGRIIEPLVTGHQKAVIRNSRSGKEESHFIRPVARSKVASVPVGIEAVFLIDELNKIVDVTFGSPEAIHQAAERWQKQTPLKGHREN
jgi:hypothetical protein